MVTSSMEQDGYGRLSPYLGNGKTVALVGSSGVGKSTLINRLLGEERLDTGGCEVTTKATTPPHTESF
ncbi:MAG: GTPase RsgA [Clostridia bacterium]